MADEKTNDVVEDTTSAPSTYSDELAAAEDARTDEEIIAIRSADIDEPKADEHVKVFVLPPGPKPTEELGFDHSANKAATRQYALNHGLRPVGDVRHVSTKKHNGGPAWALTYAVAVVPAERFEYEPEADIVTGGEETHITGQTPDKTTD